MNSFPEIRFKPIGVIHSHFKQATGTPIQPAYADDAPGHVEVDERFSDGLADLAGFDRIWLIYFFHRAAAFRLRVIPYRDTVERGVFSTRAPARPNPIGMSCVQLRRIEGNILRLGAVDILDGTPLLDIKPYVPQYDNHPAARRGWLEAAPDIPVVADGRFEGQDI